MNLLFLCSQGVNRSRTAAEIFGKKYSTDFAGVYSNYESRMLKKEMLESADLIFVMEDCHAEYLNKWYAESCKEKQVITLGIPDNFFHFEDELVKILEEKVAPYLKSSEKEIV